MHALSEKGSCYGNVTENELPAHIIRNRYQYRRLFIVFKYTERIIFYIELNGSLHDFPHVLFSNLLMSLLNYLKYWFLSIVHSPFLKCFYSIAIAGYRLIRLYL